MKKLLIPAIVAVAAISGFTGYQAQQSKESQLNDLAMANIEALTDIEAPVVTYRCLETRGTCMSGYDLATGKFWKIAGLIVQVYE